MMRPFVALLICLASCALDGCTPGRGRVTIHPLSDVATPTFCLPNQRPLKWLKVSTAGETVWALVYAPEPAPAPPPREPTLSDLVQPPAPAMIPARPFSCITYGRAPPGYIEKTPAAPLIPDTRYSVKADHRADGVYPAGLSFIIRSDSRSQRTTLEYKDYDGFSTRVRVITNLNTTEVTN